MQFLLDNWQAVVGVVVLVLGVILTGQKLAYWRWANEVLWFAWTEAERQGLRQGWRGADKLAHYLGAWRAAYETKWGRPPSEGEDAAAVNKAAELSARDKELREIVGNS